MPCRESRHTTRAGSDESSRPDRIRRAGNDPSRVTSDESCRPDRPRRAGRDPSPVISNQIARHMYDLTKQLASIHTRPVGTTRPDMTRMPRPIECKIDRIHPCRHAANTQPRPTAGYNGRQHASRRGTERTPRLIACKTRWKYPYRPATTSRPRPIACHIGRHDKTR